MARDVVIESDDMQAHEMLAYARFQCPSTVEKIESGHANTDFIAAVVPFGYSRVKSWAVCSGW